jgi:arylsulfatase A-like enzyme
MNVNQKPLIMFASVFLALAHLSSSAVYATEQPNIVFIFADDLGWGDISCHGAEEWLKTPHIDRLASEGMDFSQFNVLSPVCSSSRAAMLTGRYSFRYSIHYALHSDPSQNQRINQADWLDPRAPTLPRCLKTAGYRTAHIGKWHLGEGEPHTPGGPTMADYGFDDSLVYHGPGPKVNQRNIGVEGARAIERMQSQQPFYLNVWLHETHVKHFPSKQSMDAFKQLDPRRQVYAATLRECDNNVGMILDALKRFGLEQNTIVMFSSDNGPAIAPASTQGRGPTPEDGNVQQGFGSYYSVGSTGGLRGHKAQLFEGGVRTPFIVRWPGHVPPGVRNDRTVFTAIDMLPTICAAARVNHPDGHSGDGENLLAAFEGKSVQRTKPLFWKASSVGRATDSWCQWSMREGDWKLYADAEAKRVELFDLAKDRGEASDVSKENRRIVQQMKKQLLDWVATLPTSPDPACVSKAPPDKPHP